MNQARRSTSNDSRGTPANVGNLRDFERFLRACALRSANLLNKADLARDVGTAPSKVALNSFVFSGLIGSDFHVYWWAEGPGDTPSTATIGCPRSRLPDRWCCLSHGFRTARSPSSRARNSIWPTPDSFALF